VEPALTIAPEDWMTAPATRAVMDALRADGNEVRFVGGCVRDMLMDRAVGDIDIATDAAPERVMQLLTKAGLKAVPTGIAHGTITAVSDGKPFEVTTLRRDVETFGRHARVAFTDDWAEDAARRDFTINAMSLTVDGRLFDPFDGLADIKTGRVRFVGEARARIEEDVLRLLRYFRFFAYFDRPPPDADALAACTELAPKLPTLSGERVRAELFKLLAAPDPASTLKLMASAGVLDHLLPEAKDIARLAALTAIERDVLKRGSDPLLRLAAVLVGGTDAALSAALRFKLSNRERARLMALESSAPVVEHPDERTLRRLLQRLGSAEVVDHAWLNWAEARKAGSTDNLPWKKLIVTAENWTPIKFPIRGEDALTLGLAPGPDIGELIRAVEEWWADQDFRPDRAACLAQLKVLAGRLVK
jgi:poly(A) polymerase